LLLADIETGEIAQNGQQRGQQYGYYQDHPDAGR
jgi:hypothetical protein